MDWMAWVAERRIQEAKLEGAFDNLPGEGKPLPPDRFANLPPEFRMAARVLANAGMSPEAVGLLRELRETRQRWGGAGTAEDEARIRREYCAAELQFNVAMDRQRRMSG